MDEQRCLFLQRGQAGKTQRGRPVSGRLRVPLKLKLKPETDKLLYRVAGKEGITKSELS